MTSPFRISSIRNKLFLIIMIISGITLLLATLVFSINDRLAARKTLIYIVSSQANIVGQNAAPALTFLDREAAEEVLSGLALQNHIEVARLYDADNQKFAEYIHVQGATNSSIQPFNETPITFNGDHLELYQPVLLDGEQIGTVYVQANLETLGNRLGNYTRLAFSVFIGLLLLTWLLASRMHRSISVPLKQIVEATRQVTRHDDYSIRAKKVSDDELGELVDGINLMLEQIEYRDSKLAQYATDLEKRVADRTADLEALTKQLRHQAYHDELTGLPNRTLFVDRLKKSLAHSERTNRRLAVMFLDLDKFKSINDTLGHDVGDALLSDIANRIRQCLRKEDSVSRLGGDEFAILINHLEENEPAGKVATKIVAAIEQPVLMDSHRVQVSASIGISIFPDDHTEPDKLLTFADAAMYKAKLDPRNRYHYYQSTLQAEAEHRQRIKTAFANAITGNELQILYEPRLSVADNSLCGIAIHCYWNSGTFGHLPAEEFVPLINSEENLQAITEWTFHSAIQQLHKWTAMGLAPTTRYFLHCSELHPRTLASLITNVGTGDYINSRQLVIECKADLICANVESDVLIDTLQDNNIGLSLNNVSLETNLLNTLVKVPVRYVVLDSSALKFLDGDTHFHRLTSALTQLCHNLGIEVIASEIQSKSTYERLKNLSIDQAQGNYISKPLNAEAFTETFISPSAKH